MLYLSITTSLNKKIKQQQHENDETDPAEGYCMLECSAGGRCSATE